MICINAGADVTCGQKFKSRNKVGATASEYGLISELIALGVTKCPFDRARSKPDFNVVRIAGFRAGLSEAAMSKARGHLLVVFTAAALIWA
jgi:hypothetical protein